MRLAYAINKMKPEADNLNASLWLEVLAKCILSRDQSIKCLFHVQIMYTCNADSSTGWLYMYKFHSWSPSKTVM